MQGTKSLKKIVRSILLFASVMAGIIAVFALQPLQPVSVREYFEKKPKLFETVAEYFCMHPPSRSVLLIDRRDMQTNFVDVDVPLPQDVRTAIQDIFEHSNCDTIFLSGHLDYCQFSSTGRQIERSVVYLHSREALSKVFMGRLVRQENYLSENWMYYEALTPLAEKKVPG